MSGVEFLKVVRERSPDVVRVIISGYTDAEDIIQGVNEAGIYQYVTKPWQPDSLTLTLKNAVRLYKLQRENELLAIELKMSSNQAERVVTGRRQGCGKRRRSRQAHLGRAQKSSAAGPSACCIPQAAAGGRSVASQSAAGCKEGRLCHLRRHAGRRRVGHSYYRP